MLIPKCGPRRIPKAALATGLEKLKAHLPGLVRLCIKVMAVYNDLMTRGTGTSRIRLELMPGDIINDNGQATTDFALLDLLGVDDGLRHHFRG